MGKKWDDADERFCKVFRLPYPIPAGAQLDRLSLLACQRQGLDPTELLPRSDESFNTSSSSSKQQTVAAAAMEARCHGFEKRRRAKITIVERERREIVEVLVTKPSEKMSFLQNVLHSQLVAQPGSAVSNDPGEQESISRLLMRESDHQRHQATVKKAIGATTKQGDKEIEHIRRRQEISIRNVLEAEVEKAKKSAYMEERDKELQERRAAEKQRLKEKGELQQQIREEKLERLVERSEVKFAKRQKVLAEKAAKRDALLANIERQEAQDRVARVKQLEEGMLVVKERAAQVRTDEETKCRLLGREVTSKSQLHDKRRENLQLRLKTNRELRRIMEAKRFQQVHTHQTHLFDNVQKEREAMLATLDEATERKAQTDAERKDYLHQIQIDEEKRRRSANKRRKQKEVVHEIKCDEKEQQWARKEDHIASINQAKAEELELKSEIARQHEENHKENLARLQRSHQYRQKIRNALLEEAEQQQKQKERQKKEMRHRLTRARQHIAEERERLVDHIIKMRSSPKFAHASVEKTMESFASTSRERSRGVGSPGATPRLAASPPKKAKPSSLPTSPASRHEPGSGNANSPISETMGHLNSKRPSTAA